MTENITPPPREFNMQRALPNATAVLVLGIISIVMCCCYGIIGVICGIIALVLANKDEKLYQANRVAYTENSYKNLRAGKVCAIVGLCLCALNMLFYIMVILRFGWDALFNPQMMQQRIREMMGR